MRIFKKIIILGGAGFIGTHLSKFIIENDLCEKIFVADIGEISNVPYRSFLEQATADGKIKFINIDVRKPIKSSDLPSKVDLIFNLAAVHREPGHKAYEYFETNIRGAENVCKWAEDVDCRDIVFTSSISPYGPSREEKNEESLPVPVTPYGSSKLVAEKIHWAWKVAGEGRKLLIVRPGVVFGPGEGGNVTRLIRAVLKSYFFYIGNQETRKAGGYVKELCHSIFWALDVREREKFDYLLYNFTMDPAPTVQDYVETICRTANLKRTIPHLPYSVLQSLSYPVEGLSSLFGIEQPINPVRIKKLVRSNNIRPGIFQKYGYQYKYDLNQAMQDWQIDKRDDWQIKKSTRPKAGHDGNLIDLDIDK